jgi:uncharacterized protein YjbI with pentapeptide repeats
MANPEHIQILMKGAEAWKAWRDEHRDIRPDFRRANLSETDLHGANLSGADLGHANLSHTDLGHADLDHAELASVNLMRADLVAANLVEANLAKADLFEAKLVVADLAGSTLVGANLRGANLRGAKFHKANLADAIFTTADLTETLLTMTNLARANLVNTNLAEADLAGADLSGALLFKTRLGNTNLTGVRGLETCRHAGPSVLDHRSLTKSWPLPLAFLRGCGLNDWEIEAAKLYQPTLSPTQINDIVYRIYGLRADPSIHFHSCFISYASKDQVFAERLHVDLQNKSVRCWFAPEDMKIGDHLRLRIDESIRLYDKLLLVLSKASVASRWVEQEVEAALARERQQGTTILFPVRIDNTVMTLETGWPALIRNTRNIGDFRRWKTHDVYQKAFDRLLRDLKAAERQP